MQGVDRSWRLSSRRSWRCCWPHRRRTRGCAGSIRCGVVRDFAGVPPAAAPAAAVAAGIGGMARRRHCLFAAVLPGARRAARGLDPGRCISRSSCAPCSRDGATWIAAAASAPARHALGALRGGAQRRCWRRWRSVRGRLGGARGARRSRPRRCWGRCALLALYVALDQVMGIAADAQRRGAVSGVEHMSFVIASQIALWAAMLVLGVICIALARQIGVLHQRIAPAGALSLRQPLKLGEPTPEMSLNALDGSTVRIGGVRGGRSQLVLFVSPGLHGVRGAVAGGALGSGGGARLARHRARERRRVRRARGVRARQGSRQISLRDLRASGPQLRRREAALRGVDRRSRASSRRPGS